MGVETQVAVKKILNSAVSLFEKLFAKATNSPNLDEFIEKALGGKENLEKLFKNERLIHKGDTITIPPTDKEDGYFFSVVGGKFNIKKIVPLAPNQNTLTESLEFSAKSRTNVEVLFKGGYDAGNKKFTLEATSKISEGINKVSKFTFDTIDELSKDLQQRFGVNPTKDFTESLKKLVKEPIQPVAKPLPRPSIPVNPEDVFKPNKMQEIVDLNTGGGPKGNQPFSVYAMVEVYKDSKGVLPKVNLVLKAKEGKEVFWFSTAKGEIKVPTHDQLASVRENPVLKNALADGYLDPFFKSKIGKALSEDAKGRLRDVFGLYVDELNKVRAKGKTPMDVNEALDKLQRAFR
jgi:hypothetical protein